LYYYNSCSNKSAHLISYAYIIHITNIHCTFIINHHTHLQYQQPPPPQKQLTKWEKFALERGISPKSKRSRKQFDEATGTWKHLTGSHQNKANAGPESWPILEVKKNDDPHQDPWEKLRDEKKARIHKNTASRMKNAEHAGLLDKGSANKLTKQLQKTEKQRALSRQHEQSLGILAPAGVPVDMMKSTNGKRGKPSIALALKATQVSTASLGKFDKMREGEPERHLEKTAKKRKLLDKSGELEKTRDILNKVMNGSKEKERDVRKGKYAKGETGYDYDFDDGLGAGSFRKKKVSPLF
jgi:regulator of ribosome biosynthesis